MFIIRNWYWTLAILVVLGIGGFLLLRPSTPTPAPRTEALISGDGERVYQMTQSELDQFIQTTVPSIKILTSEDGQRVYQMTQGELDQLIQTAREKAEEAAQLLFETKTAELLEEKETLHTAKATRERRLSEVFDHIASLPKPIRDPFLELLPGRFRTPEIEAYVLAEINSRIRD